IDGELTCLYTQHRDWDLIKVTDTRVYVHETLSVTEDFDQDGVPTVGYSLSRPNFYEITPYYDVNDLDRDGYPNDIDAFPTIETEWADSDGDGIGDNSDPDNDPDGDGVLNADDAFPLDPAASLDSDGDGYPDAWNEGATEEQISNSGLVLDGMPFDPSDYLDSDGDGVGNSSDTDDDNDGLLDEDEVIAGTNPLNPDTDADGSTDGYDVFPLDAAEQSDWDSDGLGDIADTDDDNDGIEDLADLFPYSVLEATVISTDLTDATMPFGVATYLRGALDDPAVRIGSSYSSWRLLEDGTFRTTSDSATRGQWTSLDGGYVLQSEPGLTYSAQISPTLQNINWSAEPIKAGGSIELQYRDEDRFAVIETGPDIWKLAYWNEFRQYATDPTVVIDPSKPVRVSRGATTTVVPILAPTATFEPFTGPELLGSWVIENLIRDDVSLTTHCSDGVNQCSDIIRFNADNTAITETSNRSATWTLTSDGNVVLTFVDNGHEVILRRVSSGADTSTVLMSFETDDLYVNGVRMMVKRSAPAPTDMSAFIGTVLSSGFSVTNEALIRSSLDGGLIDNFGFVFNEDGSGLRLSVYPEYPDGESIRYRDVIWSQADSRFESLLCYWWAEVDGEQVCQYGQTRAWDLIKVTDSRIYVHETLSVSEDLDQDGEFVTAYSLSRPNFYEKTPYYDLDDVDRDGYSNDVDAFPFDETEWADSDGNGVGDNQDPEGDPDGDGIANVDDAFPLDAAASVDTDDDGYPDAWNANASQALIVASSLRLDAFPFDAAASLDSDGDGSPDGWNDEASESDIADSDLSLDAFPLDVAASVDSDADGYPDEWNATASESEIAASELTLDALPSDPTEWIDADGDGVGANTDLDDNDPTVGSELQDPDAIVTLSTASAEVGDLVRVYLEISDIEGLESLDASIHYDPLYLEFVSAEIEPALSGWIFQSFSPEPGVLNIATTTTSEFSGSGQLIAIDFRLLYSPEGPTPVTIASLLLNDGLLVGQPVNGSVTELIAHQVSGSVSYWSDPSRSIPSTVNVGDRQTSVSALSPDFSMGNLPTGDYTVSVSIDQSDNRAIRAYDASLVLGMAVGAIEINDLNLVVADVNANGRVNSVDARRILRYAVGLESLPFPNQESVWKTLPDSYEYTNLNTDVSDADFVGVLIGDVSGNWKPSETVSGKGSEKSSLSVSSLSASGPISTMVTANEDGTWDVTLSLIEPTDLIDVEFILRATPGVTLLSHEVLLGTSWFTEATQDATGIRFVASNYPSAVVQDVVRLTLSVNDASQVLESVLSTLDEVDYEQSLNIALGNPDADDDGLTDSEEQLLGTDPTLADTDGDGLLDGAEVELGTDPTLADTDGDGFTDSEELTEGTSPTDGDDQPLSGSRVWLYQIIIDAARASP
ncbi:MAG: cohesin domain-containing protein, partial [Luminiphilus sp.]|nr:cohesin domain-containing protein [Luminiphilus sp.]